MSNRHARYSHHPTSATRQYERMIDYESSKPTAKQRKFIASLQIKIREAGLKCDAKAVDCSRSSYSALIDELIQFCKANNIEVYGK